MEKRRKYRQFAVRVVFIILLLAAFCSLLLLARGRMRRDFVRISTNQHHFYIVADSRRYVLFLVFGEQFRDVFPRQPTGLLWQTDAALPSEPCYGTGTDPSTIFEIRGAGFQFTTFRSLPATPEAGITLALPEIGVIVLAAAPAALLWMFVLRKKQSSVNPKNGPLDHAWRLFVPSADVPR
jgi:hypothetical protein